LIEQLCVTSEPIPNEKIRTPLAFLMFATISSGLRVPTVGSPVGQENDNKWAIALVRSDLESALQRIRNGGPPIGLKSSMKPFARLR
jgi:hypothetical protein